MRLINIEIEVESAGTDEDLEETLKSTLEFIDEEPDDTGTTVCRVRSIKIEALEE